MASEPISSSDDVQDVEDAEVEDVQDVQDELSTAEPPVDDFVGASQIYPGCDNSRHQATLAGLEVLRAIMEASSPEHLMQELAGRSPARHARDVAHLIWFFHAVAAAKHQDFEEGSFTCLDPTRRLASYLAYVGQSRLPLPPSVHSQHQHLDVVQLGIDIRPSAASPHLLAGGQGTVLFLGVELNQAGLLASDSDDSSLLPVTLVRPEGQPLETFSDILGHVWGHARSAGRQLMPDYFGDLAPTGIRSEPATAELQQRWRELAARIDGLRRYGIDPNDESPGKCRRLADLFDGRAEVLATAGTSAAAAAQAKRGPAMAPPLRPASASPQDVAAMLTAAENAIGGHDPTKDSLLLRDLINFRTELRGAYPKAARQVHQEVVIDLQAALGPLGDAVIRHIEAERARTSSTG